MTMNHGLLAAYILAGINLLLGAYYHGKPRNIEIYSFWTSLAGVAILLSLVWWVAGWKFA